MSYWIPLLLNNHFVSLINVQLLFNITKTGWESLLKRRVSLGHHKHTDWTLYQIYIHFPKDMNPCEQNLDLLMSLSF